jgi:hypothetical protein
VIVKIPTHDAIWPEDVALAVGRQTNTLVLHAQATHFSQRFKAYLSVKIGGDVFANPLGELERASMHILREWYINASLSLVRSENTPS